MTKSKWHVCVLRKELVTGGVDEYTNYNTRDNLEDDILNAGRYIRQGRKMGREALTNAHKYHSKEAQEAYLAGFYYGANLVASEFSKTFGEEDD